MKFYTFLQCVFSFIFKIQRAVMEHL